MISKSTRRLRIHASAAVLAVAVFACPAATAFAAPISVNLTALGDWGTSGNLGLGPLQVTQNVAVSAITNIQTLAKAKVNDNFTGTAGTVYVDPSSLVKTKSGVVQQGDRGTGVQAVVNEKTKTTAGPGTIDGIGSASDAREALVLMFSGNSSTPNLLPIANSLQITLNGYDCGGTCANKKGDTPYSANDLGVLLEFKDGSTQYFSSSQIESTFPRINNFDQPVIDFSNFGLASDAQVSEAIVRADLGSFWVQGVQFDLAQPAQIPVPEPGGLGVAGLALAGLAAFKRRQMRWRRRRD